MRFTSVFPADPDRSSVILAYRIWKVVHQSSNLSQNGLRPVLKVIVESGVIYSLAIIAALTAFMLKSNVAYVILDMVCDEIRRFLYQD